MCVFVHRMHFTHDTSHLSDHILIHHSTENQKNMNAHYMDHCPFKVDQNNAESTALFSSI